MPLTLETRSSPHSYLFHTVVSSGECRLRVRLGHRDLAAGCPFHPQERTSSYHRGMSALCCRLNRSTQHRRYQERTSCRMLWYIAELPSLDIAFAPAC